EPLLPMIAGLFVIGEGLVRTGVAYRLGDWLMRTAGASESRLLVLLMLVAGALGAFMSSTGVVAIFIPVVLGICAKTDFSPGRLLLPLAFAAMISGMLTLIATPPNLVVSEELQQAGLAPFTFFSFTPIGVIVMIAGILVMLVAVRFLPVNRQRESRQGNRRKMEELVEDYGLRERGWYRLHLRHGSALVGQTLAAARLRTRYGATVVGIRRQERFAASIIPALADTELKAGDELLVLSESTDIRHLIEAEGLLPLPVEAIDRQSARQELGLAEVMLPPNSELIGRTLAEVAFRARHGLIVLGIKRKGQPLTGPLSTVKLAFGDSLLMAGGWRQIGLLQTDPKDFLVLSLPVELDEVAPARRQAPAALFILLAMIVAMAFNLVPNVAAVLLAALAMGLFRCVDWESAYRSINWSSLVLIAGLLPLATALQKTGGIGLIVNGLVGSLGQIGPLALLAGLFIMTTGLGLFISNTATAVLMAPIAITAAKTLGISPYPLAMTVAIASSAAFATPFSSPINTLVLEPGHYRFGDYVRLGLPLMAVTLIITLVIVPIFFPF
ncbi:MAG TPA: SLC13 family permease, partial [Candidatus Competibacteraceae bacterium]|nr:SLC13 family permease [Candidatus Competibacteraceae bacterium]